jgi:hypothetical protein
LLARDVIPALVAAGEKEGIAAFPPPGTDPPKSGILVPEDYELPPGYVRHYQVTDDGKRLGAILMFSPDYEFVDQAAVRFPCPQIASSLRKWLRRGCRSACSSFPRKISRRITAADSTLDMRARLATCAAVAVSALAFALYTASSGGGSRSAGSVSCRGSRRSTATFAARRPRLGLVMSVAFVLAVFSWFALAMRTYTGASTLGALAALVLIAPLLEPQLVVFAGVRHVLRRARVRLRGVCRVAGIRWNRVAVAEALRRHHRPRLSRFTADAPSRRSVRRARVHVRARSSPTNARVR